jgi:hypothetical protein
VLFPPERRGHAEGGGGTGAAGGAAGNVRVAGYVGSFTAISNVGARGVNGNPGVRGKVQGILEKWVYKSTRTWNHTVITKGNINRSDSTVVERIPSSPNYGKGYDRREGDVWSNARQINYVGWQRPVLFDELDARGCPCGVIESIQEWYPADSPSFSEHQSSIFPTRANEHRKIKGCSTYYYAGDKIND